MQRIVYNTHMLLNLLRQLDGCWVGHGKGRYPTIESFEYAEETNLGLSLAYPMVRWEQRTTLLPNGKAGHWELGFLRPCDDGSLELSTAQDSGRVEVVRGVPQVTEFGFQLELRSTFLGNDSRLISTARSIIVRNNELHYVKYMSTNTTPAPVHMQHLEATLRRVQ